MAASKPEYSYAGTNANALKDSLYTKQVNIVSNNIRKTLKTCVAHKENESK
jgi:hypothetical protein